MKESESQKKATRKYISGQWRPSMYIDMKYKEQIEKHFKELGYNSFNQYVNDIVLRDCGIEK